MRVCANHTETATRVPGVISKRRSCILARLSRSKSGGGNSKTTHEAGAGYHNRMSMVTEAEPPFTTQRHSLPLMGGSMSSVRVGRC
jgi:hypothetical protein